MSEVVLRWRREPKSVPLARAELRKALEAWELSDRGGDALLVVSELVTNAVRHASGPSDRQIETRFARLAAGVRIEVHDACPVRPEVLLTDAVENSGRGLFVVSAVADRWAVGERDGVGKRVWAELSLPGAGGGRSEG